MGLKKIGFRALNLINILGSIVNTIQGDLYDHFRYEDEKDIHMSSKICAANGYRHDLDLHVSNHRRTGAELNVSI